jgi:hypothetical protein
MPPSAPKAPSEAIYILGSFFRKMYRDIRIQILGWLSNIRPTFTLPTKPVHDVWLKHAGLRNYLGWISSTSESSRRDFTRLMFTFGIISGEFPVLRNHFSGIWRDWFSPSELIRVNFLYFGIISAGLRENDSSTFGINSVDFSHFGASAQTQCLSAWVRNQPNLVMEDKWVSCFLNNWEFVVTFVNRLRLIG